MRVRTILLVSLVLNVALGVALVTWVSSARNEGPRVVRSPSPALIQSNLIRIVKTNVLVRPRAFTWQEVESPDYAVYVENLRALGMPESTIRDIIVADVDQIFLQRRREDASRQDIEWWRSTPSPEVQSNILARAAALETDRASLLNRLLGEGWDAERSAREHTPLPLLGPVLGNMPDETKAAVQEIAARSNDRIRSYLGSKQAAGENPSAAELARLREESRQQFAAVLNPQQLEEFLLRFSDTASQLRAELAGFNATPDEFRSIFRAVDAIDREIQARYSGEDAASERSRQTLEQQRLAAIRNAVGPQRFTAYQTIHDPVYREALATAQRAGVGEENALALYEISRATSEEIDRIRTNPNLSAAQKSQQLREADLAQQQARALVLGETPALEAAAATTSPQPPVELPARAHAIIPGDTLGILAFQYGVSVAALREANPGIDINRARPGTLIVVPTSAGSASAPLPFPPQPARR